MIHVIQLRVTQVGEQAHMRLLDHVPRILASAASRPAELEEIHIAGRRLALRGMTSGLLPAPTAHGSTGDPSAALVSVLWDSTGPSGDGRRRDRSWTRLHRYSVS